MHRANFRPRPPDEHPMISIITLHLKRQEHTRRLISSLDAHTSLPFELVIVSQEGDAQTRAFFGEIAAGCPRSDSHGTTVLFNDRNVGTAAGRNQGLRAAGGSLVVLIDNDVEVTPGWLEPLVESMEHDAAAAAVGAMVLTPRGRPQYCSPYMVERSDPDGFRSIGLHRDRHFDADDPAINQACEVPWYPTTCLMVRPACFADHDPFDEGFAIAEEDKDLCLSLRRAGYRILYNSDSRVCHNGYPRDPDYAAIRENLKLLHQDRRRLEMKWSCSVVNEASRGFLEQSGVTPQQIARYERFPLFMRVVP
jgi:O-antigen biosynthesis protein